MQIEDVTKSIEIVNDNTLYLIDMKQWDILLSTKEIDGIPLGGEMILKILNNMGEFVISHEGFNLACYRVKWDWLFCLLYRINDKWHRVNLENTICEFCGWKGIIANPTTPSLYIAVKDSQKALNSAWNLPQVKCPNCGKELSRYAVWAE